MKKHLGLVLLLTVISLGSSNIESSRNLIHLLNYVGTDYSGAVQNGKVLNAFEYAEQKEFAKSILAIAQSEEGFKNSKKLQLGVLELNRLVSEKAKAEEISVVVHELKSEVFQISSLPRSPEKWPNIKHGKEIYSKNCTQCHGVSGQGDGPSGGNLEPKPTNFLDAKNDSISPFQYFNAIRLGVPGTAMASFQQFSEKETWDLAFYLASLRHEKKAQTEVLSHPWTLEEVASLSDHELLVSSRQNSEKLKEALAQARTFDVAEGSQSSLLALTQENLRASLEAFKNNNFEMAKTKAIAAYLDGIEPLEPKLRINNPEFTVSLEQALASVRRMIDERVSPADLEQEVAKSMQLLIEANSVLVTKPSSFWVTYSLAGGIFIREALEAALLLITLIGIIRNLGNVHALYFIHGGWISALGVGVVGWFFSGWIMGISGLRREILEGSISLFAFVILLYFGYWLHRKTEIGKWRSFINELVKTALDNKKLAGLAVVAFLGVFREAIETVLFLRALLIESPGQETALGLGVLSALVVVIVSSSVIVKFSARLPLKQLFAFSSMMMLFLAFILIGKSIHAFQEAGLISQTIIGSHLQVEWLGVFSTFETLIPQMLLAVISLGVWARGKIQSSLKTKATA